jgi:hypothetical protein
MGGFSISKSKAFILSNIHSSALKGLASNIQLRYVIYFQ